MPNILENLQNHDDHDDHVHDNNDMIELIEPNVQRERETNEENVLYQQLYNQFTTEKSNWNVHEQKLNQRIKKLENTIEEQKQHINFLNKKFNCEKKTNDSLNNLLHELNAEKLLDNENLEALKVFITY